MYTYLSTSSIERSTVLTQKSIYLDGHITEHLSLESSISTHTAIPVYHQSSPCILALMFMQENFSFFVSFK